MINAIVFDVDDTLYDQHQPFKTAVKKAIPIVLEKDYYPLYLRFRFHSDENFHQVLKQQWTLEAYRSHRICTSLEDLGYSALSNEESLLFQEIYEKELDTICLHPEIETTLSYLSAFPLTLGIITNGPTEHQAKKIQQLQLDRWIEPENILISQATGFQKPDREIFALAEDRFNLTAATTLYIGDNFDNDVLGATNSGWKALWFNHRHRLSPSIDGEKPIMEITSFSNFSESLKGFLQLSA